MTNLEHAIAHARAGRHVIPLHNIDQHGHCTCKLGANCTNAGKHPRVGRGARTKGSKFYQLATLDIAKITEWWTKWPDANIGWALRADTLVFDCEHKQAVDYLANHAGHTSISGIQPTAVIRKSDTLLASTYSARTGGGGYHLAYQVNPNPGYKNLNRLFRDQHGRKVAIDVKTYRGLVVLPPSVSHKGTYQQITNTKPSPLPIGLVYALEAANAVRPAAAPRAARPAPSSPSPAQQRAAKGYRGSFGSTEIGKEARRMIAKYPILHPGMRDAQQGRVLGSMMRRKVKSKGVKFVRHVILLWLKAQQDNFKATLEEAKAQVDRNIADWIQKRHLGQNTDPAKHLADDEDGYITLMAAQPLPPGAERAARAIGAHRSVVAAAVAILRAVAWKCSHTEDKVIRLTNTQISTMARISKAQFKRIKPLLVSKGCRRAVLCELLIELAEGNYGRPSKYLLGSGIDAVMFPVEDGPDPDYDHDDGLEAHERACEAHPHWEATLGVFTRPELKETPHRGNEAAALRGDGAGQADHVQPAAGGPGGPGTEPGRGEVPAQHRRGDAVLRPVRPG
jgi:putative DNA primase/helicase